MQNKNWIKIHQKLSNIKWLDENICEIENIRNFKYDILKSDTEDNPEKMDFENEIYDLRNIKKVWFIENKWSELPFSSHIIISFEFEEGRFLTFGLEVRKADDDVFQIYKVLWKTYNVFCVASKEEDVLFLRTHVRKEDKGKTFIYELDLNTVQARDLFKVIVYNLNILNTKNVVYKVFKTDCVSGMLENFTRAKIKVKKYFWDYSPTTVLWRSGLIKNDTLENGEKRFKNLKEVFEKTKIDTGKKELKNLVQDKNYSKEIRKTK